MNPLNCWRPQTRRDPAVRAAGMQPLGNYAYHIDFSDGHNTGIYSLEYLRQLGDEAGRPK